VFPRGNPTTIQYQSIKTDYEIIAESHHAALRLTETMKMGRREAMLICGPSAASCGRTVLVLTARRKVWPGQRHDHKTVAALWAST
jgi:hypothetical protein